MLARIVLIGLCSSLFLSVHAASLTAPICDAGARYAFETAKCTIELRNDSDAPVHISSITPIIKGDSAEPEAIVVPAKGSAYVEATIHLGEAKGVVGHSFELHAAAKKTTARVQRSATVQAFVQSVLESPRPKIDFGLVKSAEVTWPVVKELTFTSREVADLRILSVDSAPEWIDASISPDGRTLKASLKKTAPWGHTYDGAAYIKVTLNAPQQKVEWIEVTANVQGDVVADANPLDLGVLHATGKDQEFLLRLSSVSGKNFRTGKPELSGLTGKANIEACRPVVVGCRIARIALSSKQPLGGLRGTLRIELPEYDRSLAVELRGYLLGKDTVVHSIDEISTNNSSSAQVAAKRPDLQAALAESVKAEPPPLPGRGPLLRWGASHQSRIYGYLIYRAESAEGGMTRISKDVIPAIKDGKDLSGSYQWRDESAKSGTTYWYQIVALNRDATKENLSERQKVVAK